MKLITVVTGLPRSGTSLMMQMLAAGGLPVLTDGLRVPDEDNPRGYMEFEPVKRTREDSGWVEQAVGKAVKVVYLLLRDLPSGYHYRVILMRRNLREVLASQSDMLMRAGRPGSDLTDVRMATIFDQQLRIMLDWIADHPNFRVIEVNYRDCIKTPDIVAKTVNAFVGGGLDEARMATAVDPSLYRQVED
jgi:hypothetical protein